MIVGRNSKPLSQPLLKDIPTDNRRAELPRPKSRFPSAFISPPSLKHRSTDPPHAPDVGLLSSRSFDRKGQKTPIDNTT